MFTKDRRILPLCEAIVAAKQRGAIPQELQFISTNRIDAMSHERLAAMRRAGFRVLGFGIENFSRNVLEEFNKGQIHRHIEPMLSAALELGITPFLDLILSSPRASLQDVAETLARSLPLAAAGLRNRHVSVRDSILGRCAVRAILRFGRTRSTRAGMSPAPTSSGTSRPRSCPSIRRERGHPAHRTRLRSGAGGAAATRGASAFARAFAGVDSGRSADPGGARHRHRCRARGARRTRGALAAGPEGDGCTQPSRPREVQYAVEPAGAARRVRCC